MYYMDQVVYIDNDDLKISFECLGTRSIVVRQINTKRSELN